MKKNILFSILSAMMILMLAMTSVVALAADADETELTDFDRALNAAGSTLKFENDEDHPWEVVEVDGRTAVRSTIEGLGYTDSAIYWHAGTLPEGAVIKFSWKIESASDDALCMGNFCSQVACTNQISKEDEGWVTVTQPVDVAGEYTYDWMMMNLSENADGNVLYVDDVSLYIPNDFDDALNVEGGTLHFENDETHPWEVVEVDGRTAVRSTIEGLGYTDSAIYWHAGTLPEGAVIKFSWKIESASDDALCMGNFCSQVACTNQISKEDEGWVTITQPVDIAGEYVYDWMMMNLSENADGNILYVDDVSVIMPYEDTEEPLPVPEPLLGDLNENDELDAGDATLLLQHIVGLNKLSGNLLKIADANQDNAINSGDAAFILRAVVTKK